LLDIKAILQNGSGQARLSVIHADKGVVAQG